MSVEQITKNVLDNFYNICKIPHGSGNEQEIGLWLQKWANEHGFENSKDEVGNVIVLVPGKGNLSSQSPLALQGHMDMVCVKDDDYQHDFSKDPILTYIENGWMRAKHTTLGADNGIAIAIAMAIAEEPSIEHPPLELLFTVDEERGLTGANFLKAGTLEAKVLLNLDSEEEGEFTIGCAGGKDTHLELPLIKENCSDCKHLIIKISGLYGGHSGMEINQQRANAIQLMARLLFRLNQKLSLNISNLKAGLAHNAIPRDAYAKISLKTCDLDEALLLLNNLKNEILQEYINTEKDMIISFEVPECTCSSADCDCVFYDTLSTEKMIYLLYSLPHGVSFFSQNNPNLVETSNNLAIMKIENDKLLVLTSQRSSIASRNDFITEKIEAVAKLAGAQVHSGNGYPSWQPNWDSALLKKCQDVYKKLYNVDAKINVIHAGLECGIIGAKHEGMDMISMGPNIRTPHSPEEKMEIASINKIVAFLIELLKAF